MAKMSVTVWSLRWRKLSFDRGEREPLPAGEREACESWGPEAAHTVPPVWPPHPQEAESLLGG